MSFKIICTTDVHGSLLAHNFVDGSQTNRGLSCFSTYLKEKKDEGEVIFVDNGDINQGTPLVTFANYNCQENIVSLALNLLDCDFINIGNHDFNYGPKFLKKYIDSCEAKCLTVNVSYKDKIIGQPFTFEHENLKFAFLGVVTDYIYNWEKKENLKDIEIQDVFSTVKNCVKKLKDSGVDYIILFYHGGFERDLQSGEASENLTGENVGYKICSEIEGIDVLVSGHQHRSFVSKIKNTHVLQCKDGASECMEVAFCKENGFEVNIIKLENYPVDHNFERHFAKYLTACETWLDQEIGLCNYDDLYINNIEEAQFKKHPLSAFINQVQLSKMKADISAACFFDVMPGFGKKLRYRDIILNYPFPNTLVLKEISGEQLISYLNQLADYWQLQDGKIKINPKFLSPKREVYNYDMLDGISYTINVVTEGENYVSDVRIKNEPLDLNKKYRLVINNYRASGGGNFGLFPKLKTLAEDTTDIADLIIDYVKEQKYINIIDEQNIKIVKK